MLVFGVVDKWRVHHPVFQVETRGETGLEVSAASGAAERNQSSFVELVSVSIYGCHN